MKKEQLTNVEGTIGYIFYNKDLLQQAFTRTTYKNELGGEDNELLEFIGDKALDLAVIKILSDRYSQYEGEGMYSSIYNEGELTELKSKLVNSKTLSSRIDILGFSELLNVGNGDNKQITSVKEDLFEAIIGAVTLDCNWNFSVICEVVELMLDPIWFFENKNYYEINYIKEIQEWSQKVSKQLPAYIYEHNFNDFACYLTLENIKMTFIGRGNSKSDARMMAASEAYAYLEESNLLSLLSNEIGKPSYELAVNQLQELAQKGYIEFPIYTYSQSYNKDGNPIWKCIITINEVDKVFEYQDTSKKKAKKEVAYNMLCYLLDRL